MITVNSLSIKYQKLEAQEKAEDIYFYFIFYWKKIKRE